MKITQMRVCHVTNPIGFDLSRPVMSWAAQSTGAKSTASQVTVAADEKFKNIIFDSGKDEKIDCLSYEPALKLAPRTRYFWRVTVWADDGDSGTSDTAFFETGKLGEPWQASWTAPLCGTEAQPYMRTAFELPEGAVSARAYVCGLGLYELWINGKKAGGEYLTPGYHSYDTWLQYQTFDVTDLLRPGKNAVGAMLGDGWYKGRLCWESVSNIYGDRLMLICELRVKFADGSEKTIVTDDKWKSCCGPVLGSSIYDGEIFDARREISGWSLPGCSDDGWSGTEKVKCPCGPLSERRSPPVHIIERRGPEKVIITPKGETVLDFGQNMSGWVEFDCAAAKDKKIRLQYGEVLQQGCFYNDNLRSAKAEFVYYSAGEKAHVRPHFTYFGFRYVKVSGMGKKLDPKAFTACTIHSDIPATGEIETSNPLVNRLFKNACWGQRSNFVDVPTDCPQRDERMGWTGDAQIFCTTACFNMYSAAFYRKYMTDLMKEQKIFGGSVPYVVPMIKDYQVHRKMPLGHGSCAWGDVASVIPWDLYCIYGDGRLLAEQYPAMRDWVEYIKSRDEAAGGERLWQTDFHFADWLALDNSDPDTCFGSTDPYFVASAYYSYSASLTAKAAKALGYKKDAEKYSKLSAEVKNAIRKKYFTASGRCRIKTQTALVLSLFMDLAPEAARELTARELVKRLKANGNKLDTGFVGTAYLCRALSASGNGRLAYSLLLNEEYPGWLYEVKLGATTVWERWNSLLPDGSISGTGMNSLNHYAYGAIAEWMYRNMCGINPDERYPGFRRFTLRPEPDRRLHYARASVQSAMGEIKSSWEYTDGGIKYDFTVPFDTSAEVSLAAGPGSEVRCGGRSPRGMRRDGDRVTFKLLPGSCTVTVTD
jgi:alpha-L-rhamnosidase